MRTPSVLLPVVLLVNVAACRSHTDAGPGPRLKLAMKSPGQEPPRSSSGGVGLGTSASVHPEAEVLAGTSEVRTRAWAAARELKRAGAWLALGLRMDGERVRLLGIRPHEGTGGEVGAVEVESFRDLLEWALSRYVRGQRGEVVLTLRRGEGPWREEVESTGPVLSATPPQAPYEAFLRHQREKLRAPGLPEEERRECLRR